MDKLEGTGLIERVKHIGNEPRRPEFGPIWLDLPSRTVHMAGSDEFQRLTAKEYEILWLLMCVQGGHITKNEFEEWFNENLPDEEDIPLSNTIEVHIVRVREKLDMLTHGRVTIEAEGGWRGHHLKLNE